MSSPDTFPLDAALPHQYIKHFPKGEKYVSLLRNSDDPEAQAKLEVERARLRQLVKLQMQEAAAIAEADEGRSLGAVAAGVPALDAGDGSDHDAFELGTDSSDEEEHSGAEQGDSDDEAATAAVAAARMQKQQQQQRQQQQAPLAQQQAGKKRAAPQSSRCVPAHRHWQLVHMLQCSTCSLWCCNMLLQDNGESAGSAATLTRRFSASQRCACQARASTAASGTKGKGTCPVCACLCRW